METTALITFLIGSIHGTGTVDLWGSWDNFSTPYPMQKDRQKGHGHWFGTHTFKNIICDGDPSERMEPRNGALKMGSRYWYYYQRDGHTDFHNPAEPFVNDCPLLPGQTVNVLDIPVDHDKTFSAMLTSSGERLPVTMNPADRYAKLTPRPQRISLSDIIPRGQDCDDFEVVASQKQLKQREDWMTKQFGRLQTAVTDLCLSTFAGHHPPPFGCTRRQQIEAQRASTAPGDIHYQGTCGQSQPRTTNNMSKYPTRNASLGHARPRSRVGLLQSIEEGTLEEEEEYRKAWNEYATEEDDDRLTNPFLSSHASLRRRHRLRFGWPRTSRPMTWAGANELERWMQVRKENVESSARRPHSMPPHKGDDTCQRMPWDENFQASEWGDSQRDSVATAQSGLYSFKGNRSLSMRSTRTLSLRRRKVEKCPMPTRPAPLPPVWQDEQLSLGASIEADSPILSPVAFTASQDDEGEEVSGLWPDMLPRAPSPPPAPEPPSWGAGPYGHYALPSLMTSFSHRQDDRTLSNYSDLDSQDQQSSSWTPLTDSPILDHKWTLNDRVYDWSSSLIEEIFSPTSSKDSPALESFADFTETRAHDFHTHEDTNSNLRPQHDQHLKIRATRMGTFSGLGSQETIRVATRNNSNTTSPHLDENMQFDSAIDRFDEEFTRSLRLAMPDMPELQDLSLTTVPELSSPIGDLGYLSAAISY